MCKLILLKRVCGILIQQVRGPYREADAAMIRTNLLMLYPWVISVRVERCSAFNQLQTVSAN